ncbi:MAG TPA: CU044_2847 family protein [Rugosimonospora sp.]|nr:CU044_2847 family protein [Rugosimonospora sp.]
MRPDPPHPSQIELVTAGDTEFYVELADASGPRPVGVETAFSFDGVRDTVQAIASHLAQVWEHVKPAEATVKFGLSLTARSGKLTGLVVDGDAAASLKITLTWRDQTKSTGTS